MLDRNLVDFSDVHDIPSLVGALLRFCRAVECDTFSLIAVRPDSNGNHTFEAHHNMPEAYLDFFQDREGGQRDPVMQYLKRNSTPIMWDGEIYRQAGMWDQYQFQAKHGVAYGMAVATHLPNDNHIVISFDRARPFPDDPEAKTLLLAKFQLGSVFLTEVAKRLLIHDRLTLTEPLNDREREALLWTGRGKTAPEIAQILGLSENTVNKLMLRVHRKLGCVTKPQATATGVRLGII